MPHNTNNSDRLLNELHNLSHNLESLLSASVDVSKEELAALREKAQHALKDAKQAIDQQSTHFSHKAKEAAHQADDYLKDNPWKGAGIGAAIGLALGLLISRR